MDIVEWDGEFFYVDSWQRAIVKSKRLFVV